MKIERTSTDILILGSGGAGLFAAIHAKQAAPDLGVTIAVKGLLGKCGCTRMVQGGYNVALGAGDSIERHFMDTIEGGKWLSRQDLAWRLCVDAIIRVQELENEFGCFFDRNVDGSLHFKAFAGQTFDRTVHKGDLTGIEIMNRLMERVRSLDVAALEEHRAIELIPANDRTGIAGVLLVDMRTGDYRFVQARAVLLATGAGPTMYLYHTPSGDKSCDGLVMALRYGLSLRDMEMVQFHPTGLLGGPDTRMTGTVLEEGLRGAGGHLVNGLGDRFMLNYDPRGERATRDIVSRGIYCEMRAGRTTPTGGVWIQMNHLDHDMVQRNFRGMVKRCADCGFDLVRGRVEVVPTAHFLMGGIEIDPNCATAEPGLFSAGEDSGGVHGANRLGGNGVADFTVFGAIAGESMAAFVKKGASLRDPDKGAIDQGIARAEQAFVGKSCDLSDLRTRLLRTMWNQFGVTRTAADMAEGLLRLHDYALELRQTGIGDGDRAFNLTWHDWLNLQSMIEISKVIGFAAITRENSRGAHFRDDYPEPGSLEFSTYTAVTEREGSLQVRQNPVAFTMVRPGDTLLKDEPGQPRKIA